MPQYSVERGTTTGVRIADERGKTVTAAGRVFDNMSLRAAEQVIASLENLDKQRQERRDAAFRRNDLLAILDDGTAAPKSRTAP